MLGPAVTALGLSLPTPQPLSLLGWGWGLHGFAGVCDPSPLSLMLASLPSSLLSPSPDCSLGEGGRVLGEAPQVTEQTASTRPQPPGVERDPVLVSPAP